MWPGVRHFLASLPVETIAFEVFHYVVAVVCLTGAFLALVGEEPSSHGWVAPLLPTSTNRDKEVDHTFNKMAQTDSVFDKILQKLGEVQNAAKERQLLHNIVTWFSDQLNRLHFAISATFVKGIAQNKRQFNYMMQKRILGVPIDRNETEEKSYLDVKRTMAGRWPFMLEVSDVKSEKITYDGCKCYPMSSYNYLDFIRDDRVNSAGIEAAKLWASGNHGPRMLGGNTTVLRSLEHRIARFFGRGDALVCSSGFLACMSGIVALAQKGDVVFSDNRAHASLRAGLKLCGARVVYFNHNDYKHAKSLITRLRNKSRRAFLLVESVYSMDGDVAHLPTCVDLCKKYNVELIIDEAHGLGALGATGRGLEEHFNMQGVATLIMGTFSKSISSVGGYITGSKDLIEYCDFHTPGNCFSAPLAAYCAGAAHSAFNLIDEEGWRIKKLQENSRYLREALTTGLGHWPKGFSESLKYELEGDPTTPVIPVVFPDDIDRVMRIAHRMKLRGYMVACVAFPACPLRRPRFRVTATTAYTKELMDSFVKELVEATVALPMSESAQQVKRLAGSL
eukprot:GHVN01105849.1.p1 GENE.GHVN01105849.1~~GHVN01105849.1.p1  ORF type:complete len:564 (+),score=40.87 GHVN01105849.1:85-1776(+)